MIHNRGVSPIVSVLLLVALVVGLSSLYATVATDLVGNNPSDEYRVPNVDTNEQDGHISAQLLDKGDMSNVEIKTPQTSTLDNIYLNEVGESTGFTVSENDTGTYRIVGVTNEGREILVENIQVGEPADDSVEDLELLVLVGSVQGGENSVSFELKNTGESEISLTKFRVDKVHLDELTINTETPPSTKAWGKDEVKIDSNPDDGYCGRQKPKEIPINESERFENCQASSEPSVTGSGATMEVTFNGVEANKETDFIGLSPKPKFTDMAITMFGATGQSIRIPLTLDTFVIPQNPDATVYDKQLSADSFDVPPSTILVRDNITVKQQIKNLDNTSIYVSQGSLLEDELENVKAVTSSDDVTFKDDIYSLDGGVFLGSYSQAATVSQADSFRIGSESVVTGEIEYIDGNVNIGSDTNAQDAIEYINGTVTLKNSAVADSSIYDVSGDVILHDNVNVNGEISSVSGDIICGENVQIATGSCDKSMS